MTVLLMLLAGAGLFGCYDIACRMDAGTRHGMRLAVWMIGLGCIAVMAGQRDIGLALVLAGIGLFRALDRRTDHGTLAGRRT